MSCLVNDLLQSIWICGEICLCVFILIRLFISLSRQFLVLSIILFIQLGLLEKSVLLLSYSSAYIPVSPGIVLSRSSSENASGFQLKSDYVCRRCLLHDFFSSKLRNLRTHKDRSKGLFSHSLACQLDSNKLIYNI